MKLRWVLATAVAGALLLAAAPSKGARQDPAEDEGHPDRPLVSVSLSAADKEGRPVEGLRAEDLRVTADGRPQQLVFFSKQTEEPLHVVLMLDASVSQERILPEAQPAAGHFILSLLRAGRDDAAVVSFSDGAKVVQKLTGDATAAARAVVSIKFVRPPGYVGAGVLVYGKPPKRSDPAAKVGTTAIWDSLAEVCDELFAQTRGGRRVVVLVTDGVDTSSRVRLSEVVERLTRDGVAVYSVGIGEEFSFEGVDKSALRKLSEPTGGRAVFPKKPKDLPEAFERIRGELLNAYALKLAAPTALRTGKPLKLRVEVVNPELRKRGVQLAYPQLLFDRQAAPTAGRP